MKKRVTPDPVLNFTVKKRAFTYRPIVVGAGPAGLFAALTLARAGARPILVERGLAVDERRAKVDLFNRLGVLDTECNVQFGEGGAGTYSDGKLKYGSMDAYKLSVLRDFVRAGADESILYSTSAHVGTDRLSDIVKKLRCEIISLGGEVRFSTKLVGIGVRNSAVTSVTLLSNGEEYTLDTG
ncbi:MAG: FAD-dependent monooxygenase, partial [Clostridia bacterium]|nr:FAD-dependent monooxygenase [Clostridia bacterium]